MYKPPLYNGIIRPTYLDPNNYCPTEMIFQMIIRTLDYEAILEYDKGYVAAYLGQQMDETQSFYWKKGFDDYYEE